MGHVPERVTSNVAHEGELIHILEGGGGNFGPDTEGCTLRVDFKGLPTKSGYLNFDPGGISTINWRPSGGQVSESRRSPRGEPSSEPSKKPTVSSDMPIPL